MGTAPAASFYPVRTRKDGLEGKEAHQKAVYPPICKLIHRRGGAHDLGMRLSNPACQTRSPSFRFSAPENRRVTAAAPAVPVFVQLPSSTHALAGGAGTPRASRRSRNKHPPPLRAGRPFRPSQAVTASCDMDQLGCDASGLGCLGCWL